MYFKNNAKVVECHFIQVDIFTVLISEIFSETNKCKKSSISQKFRLREHYHLKDFLKFWSNSMYNMLCTC